MAMYVTANHLVDYFVTEVSWVSPHPRSLARAVSVRRVSLLGWDTLRGDVRIVPYLCGEGERVNCVLTRCN